MEQLKLHYHIVLTIYCSRTSQRILRYNNKPLEPENLTTEHEIILTKLIKEIILKEKLECYSYNICRDHVHLLIASYPEELPQIIKTIKGRSSRRFNQLFHKVKPLWSRRYYAKIVEELSFKEADNMELNYFQNVKNYIENNRAKHRLPESKELVEIIESFIIKILMS